MDVRRFKRQADTHALELLTPEGNPVTVRRAARPVAFETLFANADSMPIVQSCVRPPDGTDSPRSGRWILSNYPACLRTVTLAVRENEDVPLFVVPYWERSIRFGSGFRLLCPIRYPGGRRCSRASRRMCKHHLLMSIGTPHGRIGVSSLSVFET